MREVFLPSCDVLGVGHTIERRALLSVSQLSARRPQSFKKKGGSDVEASERQRE